MIEIIKRDKLFVFFFSLLVLSTLFFRLYRLGDIPYGLNNDAAWEGSAALDIVNGARVSDYIPYALEGWRGEGIIRGIVAILIVFIGNNPINIRLATTFFGIALIVPMFLLINLLFDRKLALVSTFLLSISGWHIIMSRSGWRAICLPFFSTLFFYLLFLSIRERSRLLYVFSGAALSIVTFYTYDAARSVPITFFGLLVVEIVIERGFLRRHFRNLIFLSISFLIISIPMIIYSVNNWENFTSRSKFLYDWNYKINPSSDYPLLYNIKTSALLFTHNANGNDFFINEPLLDNPMSFLFVVGFVVLIINIIRSKKVNYIFILLWLIGSLLPGLMSSPNGNRAIGAIPSVMFICALGLITLSRVPSYFSKKKKLNTVSNFIVIIVLIYATIVTTHKYFGSNRREIQGMYPETLVVTNHIKEINKGYDIYLTDNYPRELLTYYLYQEGLPAFHRNYTWLESSYELLDTSRKSHRNINSKSAYFMFATSQNEEVADMIMSENPNSKKYYLMYFNDNIQRPASLVVLVN